MTVEETQKEIVNEFEDRKNWFDKRKYLIQLGKEMPFAEKARATDDNLIRGCQVSTWFYSEFKEGRMFYEIDSASAIVKGIAALMVRIFSGKTPDDICSAKLDFIDGVGLSEDFSPIRANSLLKMLGRVKADAAAHQSQIDSGMAIKKTGTEPENGAKFNIKRLIKNIYEKMRDAL